uniref:Uncharacterized protein n=1 Tax=Arundo donax TaxID=35708 RepID=A0A0A9DBG3_ARUDO
MGRRMARARCCRSPCACLRTRTPSWPWRGGGWRTPGRTCGRRGRRRRARRPSRRQRRSRECWGPPCTRSEVCPCPPAAPSTRGPWSRHQPGRRRCPGGRWP